MLSSLLKASLPAVVLWLCVIVAIANAESGLLGWTSPTTRHLNSLFMVNATEGWAVGYDGVIIRWSEIGWVPELPTVIIVPLLVGVTLIAVILVKTASQKYACAIQPTLVFRILTRNVISIAKNP